MYLDGLPIDSLDLRTLGEISYVDYKPWELIIRLKNGTVRILKGCAINLPVLGLKYFQNSKIFVNQTKCFIFIQEDKGFWVDTRG